MEFTALSLKVPYSWDMTSYHWVIRHRRFESSIFEIKETDYLVKRSNIPNCVIDVRMFVEMLIGKYSILIAVVLA
jgi:hypothetical protein